MFSSISFVCPSFLILTIYYSVPSCCNAFDKVRLGRQLDLDLLIEAHSAHRPFQKAETKCKSLDPFYFIFCLISPLAAQTLL